MITITGNLFEVTSAASTGSFVRFWLRNAGGNQPYVSGVALLAPDGGNSWYADMYPNGSGAISGNLYSTSDVTVGGVTGVIYYGMQVYQNGFFGPESPVSAANSFSINNPPILSTLPVVSAPTGDSTYLRLDGANSPVTGSIAVKELDGIFNATLMGAGTSTANINAAAALCPSYSNTPGIGAAILLPPGMAAGEGSSLADNVILIDYRGTAQSQGLRFNLPTSAAGNVRSKMYLQDNYNGAGNVLTGGNSGCTLYVQSYVDKPDSTTGTIAAINGTQNIDSQTGAFNGTLVGIEGECFTNATNGVAYTNHDIRGATFNCGTGGNTSATRMVSLYAQFPANNGSGSVTNAYSLYAEAVPTTVTGESQGFLNAGTTRLADRVAVGSLSSLQSSVGLAVYDPANITGANQFGIQSSIQTTSGSTSEGAGIVTRADTAASAYTQSLNTGMHVQAPIVGAGSSITEWNGIRIDSATPGSTNYCFKSIGSAGVFLGGKVATYNNQATAGIGTVPVYAITSQKAETGADTNVLTFTPPAVAGSYRVRFVMSLSAANTATLGWTMTWKDSNGNAQTPTNLSLFQSGTAAPALTFATSSAGNYYADANIDIDNSATNIVVKLTFTGTSFAGKVTATIEQIA